MISCAYFSLVIHCLSYIITSLVKTPPWKIQCLPSESVTRSLRRSDAEALRVTVFSISREEFHFKPWSSSWRYLALKKWHIRLRGEKCNSTRRDELIKMKEWVWGSTTSLFFLSCTYTHLRDLGCLVMMGVEIRYFELPTSDWYVLLWWSTLKPWRWNMMFMTNNYGCLNKLCWR